MKDGETSRGQAYALVGGAVMLFFGGSAWLESVEAGEWLFRYRTHAVVNGDLALALIAISLLGGSYLVLSAVRRL